jgi:hypothetical protein
LKKEIVYYTDVGLREPIFSVCQDQILRSGLPVVSCSLKPINFGRNIVLDAEPNIITMYRQILTGLKASEAKVVFLCEHDVLYHPSHFDYEPEGRFFCYNTNVWWWEFPKDRLVAYDFIKSQSGLCGYRELLIDHYTKRLEIIYRNGWDRQLSREPRWARMMGYEPGTKSERQEMISDEDYRTWQSEFPNIDIRHGRTMTPTKCHLESFKHPPTNWRETTLDQVEGWDLKKIKKRLTDEH